MGVLYSVYSYLGLGNWVEGRTDDPDPVTGLTSRDKNLIKTSWDRVRKDPTGSGVLLLNLWFERFPEDMLKFPFRDVPKEEQPTNRKYKAHGNSIIYAVSSIVDAINDDDMLLSILEKIAESHANRKIQEKSFKDLKKVLIELFSSVFTEEEMKAWGKALDVMFVEITRIVNEKLSSS